MKICRLSSLFLSFRPEITLVFLSTLNLDKEYSRFSYSMTRYLCIFRGLANFYWCWLLLETFCFNFELSFSFQPSLPWKVLIIGCLSHFWRYLCFLLWIGGGHEILRMSSCVLLPLLLFYSCLLGSAILLFEDLESKLILVHWW